MRARTWMVEILLFALYGFFGLNWLAYGPAANYFEQTLHLDHASSAALISVVSLANAFLPIFGGHLYERWGGRTSITVASVLMSMSVFCPWVTSFWLLLVLRFLFGLGGALVATLTSSIVMKHFDPSKFQLLSGFNNVSVNVGITAAIYFSPDWAARLGWQSSLTLMGSTFVILTLAWLMTYTARFEQESSPEADASKEDRHKEKPVGLSVYRDPVTWWLVLGFLGPLGSYLALNTWMPQLYIDQFGWKASDASALLAFLNLVGLPAAPIGGWLADRWFTPRQILIAAGLGLPVTTLMALWLPQYAWLSAGLAGFFFLLYIGPFFTIPMQQPHADPERVARQIGVVMSVAYLVTFGSPVLVGHLKDIGMGLAPGLTLMAISSASLLVGSIFACRGSTSSTRAS